MIDAGGTKVTPEELEQFVKRGDADKLVEAMRSLDESERRKLAKAAARLFRARNDNRNQMSTVPFCASLAVLGLCSWTDAKHVAVIWWGKPTEPIYRVLKARRPEWLNEWVEKELANGDANWPLIRRLVRAGICQRQASDSYVLRMAQSRAGHSWYDSKTSLAEWLRKDGDILMDLWRIFEIDFGREGVFVGDGDGHPHSWQSALLSLANSGELSRERMLSASLTARQTRPDNATFFCKLHEALSPTVDERVQRQEHYRALLSSPIPNVVGFAQTALKVIAQAGKLEIDPLLAAIGPALELRQKGHATAAAQVLELAAKQSPEQLRAVAATAARGLAHASPEVQNRCAKLIEAAAALGADEELAAAIDAQLGSITASVRPRVEAALAKLRAGSDVMQTGVAAAAPAVISEAEIEAIPPQWRRLAGVDECVKALRGEGDLPSLQFDPMAVPRLGPDAALAPIATFDELVDRASAAVEELADADEFELLLDGLSRLSGHLRLDFAARTAPLLNRVEKLIRAGWNGGTLDAGVRFRFLVRSWLERQPLPTTPGDLTARCFEGFLTLRMAALSNRLPRDLSGPLLACPTHRGEWIDPRELVARLRFWQARDVPGRTNIGGVHEFSIPDRYDFIQALLRLAPDHRAEALAAAGDLAGEAGAALRFALGGDEPIGRSPGPWIAAARARQPFGAFPALVELHGDLGPDAAMPATYEWVAYPHVRESWLGPAGPQLQIRAVPAVRPDHLAPDRPLAYLNRLETPYYFASVLHLRCRSAVWPANPSASFAGGAMDILARLNQPPSSFSPTAQTLDPLFDPDTPSTEMARLALAVALLSKDAGTRGLGIDALIALVEDGRCTGDEWGPIYGKLASKPEVVRLNRLVATLADVARVSELHQWAVTRILAGTLAALRLPPPDDLHHLLSALHEGLIATAQPLPPECRPILESVTTSGKTAKLAKSLLALQPAPGDNRHRLAAMNIALAGRVARAKRWARRESESKVAEVGMSVT
ncbi:MAG TPA: DUF6493 family protein [Tepidisphaeraceae bacterium]|jgi:hypothetical protein